VLFQLPLYCFWIALSGNIFAKRNNVRCTALYDTELPAPGICRPWQIGPHRSAIYVAVQQPGMTVFPSTGKINAYSLNDSTTCVWPTVQENQRNARMATVYTLCFVVI
jgi:hypothetical protein